MTRDQSKWKVEILAFLEGREIEVCSYRAGEWEPWIPASTPSFETSQDLRYRIKPDPIPHSEQVKIDKWAKERAAYAEGKAISYRYKFAQDINDKTPPRFSKWFPCRLPPWTACDCEFMIAPEPAICADKWSKEREAFKQGKIVDWDYSDGKTWTGVPDGEVRLFDNPALKFRVRPEPRYRPFRPDEVPVGKIILWSRIGNIRAIIIGVDEKRLYIHDGIRVDFDKLLKEWTFEDGTPCGVEIKEGE